MDNIVLFTEETIIMRTSPTLSRQTRLNWLIDAAVFGGAVVAFASGLYFLLIPSGGYQGGRNTLYGVTLLFPRETWDHLHQLGGLLMIAAAVVHFVYHWSWVRMMARRVLHTIRGQGGRMSRGARINLAVDTVLIVSFLLTALSGLYFLVRVSPDSGGFRGGANASWDSGLLFDRATWDTLHTWAGAVLIGAAVVHFAIHWRWVTSVTRRFFLSLIPARRCQPALEDASG